MPNPMLPPWSAFIPALPVQDQVIKVELAIWNPKLAAAGLGALVGPIFGGAPTVWLSRRRLLGFAYPSAAQKCVEILMWGYPRGMRNKYDAAFLANVGAIAALAGVAAAWPAYFAALNALPGMGLSTITKLAYFHGHAFGGFPALILDSRLIEVLASGRWAPLTMPGLSVFNARNQYLVYLDLACAAAVGLGCPPENVEFTLFALGDAFL